MYDAASNGSSKLSKFIVNGECNFSRPTLNNLQRVVQDLPSIGTTDYVVWGVKNDSIFTCAKSKEAIKDRGERVNWSTVVWGKGYIPKLAIILWLAFKKRLLTKSRLKGWGYIQDDTCCICNNVSEDLIIYSLIVLSPVLFGL